MKTYKKYKTYYEDASREQILKDTYIDYQELTNLKAIEKEYQRINGNLQKRINKAIAYLKDREEDNQYCSICSVMSDRLLKILKGSNKHVNSEIKRDN